VIDFQAFSVEPAEIEPATSCLQTRLIAGVTVSAERAVWYPQVVPTGATAIHGTEVDDAQKAIFEEPASVPPAGFEPAISCVKGRRPDR
jgi:hypothetical protein